MRNLLGIPVISFASYDFNSVFIYKSLLCEHTRVFQANPTSGEVEGGEGSVKETGKRKIKWTAVDTRVWVKNRIKKIRSRGMM